MAVLRMSTVFAQCANDLPPEEKMKLTKIFLLLTDNPQHPSLQLQKIQGARRSNVYECRLDKAWRIILERTGAMTYDLIYVGPHDEAIGFGARLREPPCGYGYDTAIVGEVSRYLAGSDGVLEFVPVTESDLQRWTSQ